VDTVGGDVAAKLIAKVKQSGSFGYTAVLQESAAAKNPTVKITRVRAQPDPAKVREFAASHGWSAVLRPLERAIQSHSMSRISRSISSGRLESRSSDGQLTMSSNKSAVVSEVRW
jgi:hypothetical protein